MAVRPTLNCATRVQFYFRRSESHRTPYFYVYKEKTTDFILYPAGAVRCVISAILGALLQVRIDGLAKCVRQALLVRDDEWHGCPAAHLRCVHRVLHTRRNRIFACIRSISSSNTCWLKPQLF